MEDEAFANTSSDDETKGRILLEIGVSPKDAVALTILCDSSEVKELVSEGVDIEEETFSDTSDDDDETQGRRQVEFGVTLEDAVALTILCDSGDVKELLSEGVDIEEETFANTSDDDETEGKILVEFGVTARDMVALAILFDSDMAIEVAGDRIDIEDETFADTLDDDDETEGKSLEESFVIPRDAVPLAVFCDSEKGKEFVAVCFDTEDETFPNTADADEAESIMLEKTCVTPKDAVALVVLDTVMFTKLVAGSFDMEDDIFTVT